MLAQQGASVYLVGRTDRVTSRARELKELGHVAHASHGDLGDATFVAELIPHVVATLGGIDVLVNNAGMTSVQSGAHDLGEVGSIDELTLEGWNASLQRNLTSAFLLTKAALPFIRKSTRGRIINISSVTGPLMAMSHEVAYASSKAALIGFTRALALDEATTGANNSAVTVNAIAPGWIATESSNDFEKSQGLLTPMKRSGTPLEIASAIAWLASAEASYVTGQMIVIDGGNSIKEER
jgi:3-oxoacyl-[acyl-carrier protein] reductase